MRLGIRPALVIFVLATVALTSGIVHGLWWQTAQANSRMLADTLNRQIVGEVKKELASLIASAEAAHGAIKTIFVQEVIGTREADKREFVFLSQLQAQPVVSWIAFGWPDGSFFAAHKLGDRNLEMMELPAGSGPRSRRVDEYRVLPGDIEFERRTFVTTDFDVVAQPWYRQASESKTPLWVKVTRHSAGSRPTIAYAGSIDVDQTRQGVLAVMIDLDRFSRFLAGLTVGRTGAAFIVGQDNIAVAVPDPEADEVHGTMVRQPSLLAVARETHARMLKAGMPEGKISEARVVRDDIPYAVTSTPLDFMGWDITTVVPESDFLGTIDATTRHLGLTLLGLVAAAIALSMLLARVLLVRPLVKIAGELGRVQRFELEQVRHYRYRLRELDTLSGASAGMAAGLSAFRRYMPADLVKALIAEGVEARPGGTVRPLTILFTDIEDFTGMSERAGNAVVPVLERYIGLISDVIHAHGGTIDKFIGDAIMAFWGAPEANPAHALDACRAALACREALALAAITDDRGQPLVVRIGINSGDALVGNIGSTARLNYTAIGDAVNIASRIEGANKQYGTRIIIGETTRHEIGEALVVRELDRVALSGRTAETAIFELIDHAEAGGGPPAWIATYEEGLDRYRRGCFDEAIACFEAVVALRGGDRPSTLMIERCRAESAPASLNATEPAPADRTPARAGVRERR